MVIDISKIVSDKLSQMEQDGVIQKAIEDGLEKAILGAVSSALSSHHFRNQIEKQIDDAVGGIAGNCGLSAYNGFIAQKAAEIVQNMYNNDISEKVQKALNDTLIHRYENVKLSEIFEKYRSWVLENTDESEKYEYERFTCDMEVTDDGKWRRIVCRFVDKPLDRASICGERGDIEIRIHAYGGEEKSNISGLWLNNRDVKSSVNIGVLTSFETFLVNLYYNKTEIELDVADVDEDNYYDIDV